jgi:hypothetical protein
MMNGNDILWGQTVRDVSNQHVSTWRKDGSWWGLSRDVPGVLALRVQVLCAHNAAVS